MKQTAPDFFSQPVTAIARTDFAVLRDDMTVHQAMDDIRLRGLGERILYFYVENAEGRLVGVIPTRRLLTGPLEQQLSAIMIDRVVSLAKDTTVLEAHRELAARKLLALPVVNESEHVIGQIDVSMFTDEELDPGERQRMDEVFEIIGFRVRQERDASPFRAFRTRFPWLLATIASGLLCALFAGKFELTLAKSLLLAFFLTMVLGLGESVSIQSMTLTIQSLRSMRPTFRWYLRTFIHETALALLLGAGCGFIVSSVIFFFYGAFAVALAVGSSILVVITVSSIYGLSVPSLLHALRLDPKIAAGPLTLAFSDISTILIYFALATILL